MYNQLHGYCMGTVIISQNCLINNQVMRCRFLVGTFELQQFNLLSIVEFNAHLVNLHNIGNTDRILM
jgi:hypothetical protein